MFDQNKQRLVEYQSHPQFNARVVEKIVNPFIPSRIVHEKFTSDDYSDLYQKSYVPFKNVGEANKNAQTSARCTKFDNREKGSITSKLESKA